MLRSAARQYEFFVYGWASVNLTVRTDEVVRLDHGTRDSSALTRCRCSRQYHAPLDVAISSRASANVGAISRFVVIIVAIAAKRFRVELDRRSCAATVAADRHRSRIVRAPDNIRSVASAFRADGRKRRKRELLRVVVDHTVISITKVHARMSSGLYQF